MSSDDDLFGDYDSGNESPPEPEDDEDDDDFGEIILVHHLSRPFK